MQLSNQELTQKHSFCDRAHPSSALAATVLQYWHGALVHVPPPCPQDEDGRTVNTNKYNPTNARDLERSLKNRVVVVFMPG